MPCGASLFCYIGNYVKNRAASTERLGFAKQFGSGSGTARFFEKMRASAGLPVAAAPEKGYDDIIRKLLKWI